MSEQRAQPLRVYLLAVVLAMALLEAALGVLAWRSAVGEARRSARSEAEVVATLARTELQRSFVLLRAEAETAAENQELIAAAKAESGPCGLRRSRLSVFPVGHVSVLGRTGDIICSTMPDALSSVSTYRFQRWLSAARRTTEAVPSGPYADPFLQQQSVAVAASMRDSGRLVGFVVHVLPLDGLAQELRERASTRSRAVIALLRVDTNQTLSFVGMEAPDPDQVPPETPSAEPQEWSTATERIWAGADMPDHGWRIYAGIRDGIALTSVWSAARGHVLAAGASLLLGILLVLAIERRVGRPIRRMSSAVQIAADGGELAIPRADGPEEVRNLEEAMRRFLADRLAADQDLRRLAFVDPATGLSNRTRLGERLREIASAGTNGVLMMIGPDPDPGHLGPASDTDDARILEIAERLAALVPPNTSIHRVGANELALLSLEADDAAIRELSELIAEQVSLSEDGREVRSGIEIFASETPDPDDLLRRAVAALERARALSVRSYVSGASDAA